MNPLHGLERETMLTITREIAGLTLTLTPGRRYIATRPMGSVPGQRYDVTVSDITDDRASSFRGVTAASGLDYDRANEVLAAFNDGPTSFEGRVW